MNNMNQRDNTPRGASPLYVFAKTLYYALPRRVRILARPMASRYELLRGLRPEVWMVAGKEKGSHLPLSICLYATTKEYRSYLLELIFGSSFHARYLGRTWLWKVFKTIPKAAAGCSMVFAEVDQSHLKVLGARGGIVIPAWVSGEVNLPRGPKVMRSKSLQFVLRKIRRHGLEFEISRDPQRFADFYHNMYLPTIKGAHGDSAFFVTKQDMKAELDNGELLLVKKQGEYISGQLIAYDGAGPFLRWLGVRDGNQDYLHEGAVAASYEFSLRRAEEKGYKKLSLGRSRAFLQDGVLRFKRKLPQTIVGTSSRKFLVQALSDTNSTRAFLQNTPFIFERFGELHGAVFVDSDTPPTPQALREIHKQYFHAGLSKLVVYCLSPRGTSSQNGIEPEVSPDRALDTSSPLKRPHHVHLSSADGRELIKGLGCIGIGMAITIHPCGTGKT